ncbi:MAG: CDP-alcohol phosphatidyltransferase family protein [Gemmatimonadota bacterium]
MTPATGSFHKGDVVEEWIDLHFYRPLGLRVARALRPTPLSADHVTILAVAIGLVAGRLCFYDSWRLNLLGFGLFVVSDIFDSADGQLARMRGTSTRFGRVLDGAGDSIRFVNLFLQLALRVTAGGGRWTVWVLAAAAGWTASIQANAIDFMRQAWSWLTGGGAGELDLPEDVDRLPARTALERLQRATYRDYVNRQVRLLPHTAELVRRMRSGNAPPDMARWWAERQERTIRRCAWVGQNLRIFLVALTVVPGWVTGYFWVQLIPMNLILIALVRDHERTAAECARPLGEPLSVAGVA